jgi:DNA-directed RNA polymerase specialized sigma24 family protein/tRNA A-37 threonylcarbamoyl transferase component Bud32
VTAATDAELVDAFLVRGQDAAFVELVRRHQIPIYRRLAVDLADPDDAEAVCEAAFVVASQRLDEWPRGVPLKDWLLGVAAEVGASRRGEAADPEAPRFVDPAVFFKHSVHQALQALSAEDRALLIAVDLEGQKAQEVAAAQGVAVEQVSEALETARARFTQSISEPKPADQARKSAVIHRVTPGEIIDNRYRVEELLGEGGMATVFRAEHMNIKRKVALKTLRPTRQTQAMIRERFTREAEVLGRLAHPNFVDVSDFGESARGISYLVMELLNGHPLSSELREHGKLHPARTLRIAAEVCKGLQFAHELGIIHRDIKPDNVVVLNDESGAGFAKILDLGVAATSDESENPDKTLYGTPAYMAPEQIQGTRIDGRVDLYALGVMLFELLTGEQPFRGGTIEFVLVQQLASTPPRLADVNPELPEVAALQGLLDQCLAKDPADRIRSARALEQQIEGLLVKLGDAPAPARAELRKAAETGEPSVARASSRLGLVWVAVAVLLVAALVLAFWLWA